MIAYNVKKASNFSNAVRTFTKRIRADKTMKVVPFKANIHVNSKRFIL